VAYASLSPDAVWSADLVGMFPASWQAKMLAAYKRIHMGDGDGHTNGEKRRAANFSLLKQVRKLTDAASAHIRPDAGDSEVCKVASNTARSFFDKARNVAVLASRHTGALRFGQAFIERACWLACRALLIARGLVEFLPKAALMEARVARLCCDRFWRRKLRTLQARTVEAVAIDLELVNRNRGLYVSDDAVSRRAGQLVRNQRALESTTAINEYGQEYKLADLAAKGMANKEIRRAELMTRIAGFELIAKSRGHAAMMVTPTCPSRMHKMRTTKTKRVVANAKYDGTTPKEAQQHLSAQWARARAMAAKMGVKWYGFRIAEPQQDGTPHWHMLLFFEPEHLVEIQCLMQVYFWFSCDPFEPGAHAHRVDFEVIDWAKGSAASYIAKYVAKNIDGYKVGQDLYGNDAITSSRRVDAWASSWGIRQFQQVGGAPVGVWRELRRMNPENLSEHDPVELRELLSVMNLQKTEPGLPSAAWKKFNVLQGGVFMARADMKVRLYKEDDACIGRYGERLGLRTVGVECEGVNMYSPGGMAGAMGLKLSRTSFISVETERCGWVITSKGVTAGVHEAMRRDAFMRGYRASMNNNDMKCDSHRADYLRGFEFGKADAASRQGVAAPARIHVNNCNGAGVAPRYTAAGETIKDGYFNADGVFTATCVHSGGAIKAHRHKLGRWAVRHE
jgi:hypothetical protein